MQGIRTESPLRAVVFRGSRRDAASGIARHPSFLSMQHGITKSMKTAISVEDSLMEQADKAARDLGLSRSGLIAEALRDYLRQRRRAQITRQLNRAYADKPGPDERRLVRNLRTKLSVPDTW